MDRVLALLQKFCPENICSAAQLFVNRLKITPRVALVLGSGWDSVLKRIKVLEEFDYGEFFTLPDVVSGHKYKILVAQQGKTGILFFLGRLHLYQGYNSWQVAFPVLFSALSGVSDLVLTNAAGSLKTSIEPGTLLIIQDQLDFTFLPDFPYRVRPVYDEFLSNLLFSLATQSGIRVQRGVYAGVLGPSYETPQEVRMLGKIGADVVGMSTVKETKLACTLGLKVVGVSLVTNWGSGISERPLSHAEVLKVVSKQGENLSKLFQVFLEELSSANCGCP